MYNKNKILGVITLVISMTVSVELLARGEGGFDHGFNNNDFHSDDLHNNYNNNDAIHTDDFHNDENNKGYNNSFYYDNHVNEGNGFVVIPADSDVDSSSSCQSAQICDASGNCVTQQNCN